MRTLVHHWWECKMVELLWEMWQFLEKIMTVISFLLLSKFSICLSTDCFKKALFLSYLEFTIILLYVH